MGKVRDIVLQERDVCFGYHLRVTLFNINHFYNLFSQFRDIGVNIHFWHWGLIRPRTLIRPYRNHKHLTGKLNTSLNILGATKDY